MKRYFYATIILFLFVCSLGFSQKCSACGLPVNPTGQTNQWGKKEFQCVYGHKSYQPSANSDNPLAPITKILNDRRTEVEKDKALINDFLKQRRAENQFNKERAYQEQREFNHTDYIFNDPKKQLEFEKSRLYMGGDSRDLYFLENGKTIKYIDLLEILGLENERQRALSKYNQEYETYESKVDLINQNPTNIRYEDHVYFDNHEELGVSILLLGGVSTMLSLFGMMDGDASEEVNTFTILSWAIFISGAMIPIKTKIETKKIYPQKPQIRRVMSNDQIKGLVRAYNNNLYNEISNKGISKSSSENNIESELKKYKEMLDNGLITEEDYNAKKKQLLGL